MRHQNGPQEELPKTTFVLVEGELKLTRTS